MANGVNIKKLEADLWESADLLRSGSKLTSNQYCMPVLGLIFLRYAYSRFKKAEAEILKNRPTRGGRVLPVEASDFAEKSAIFLPKEAQYSYLVNLPANIPEQALTNVAGQKMNSLGEVVNNAMDLVEAQSEQLSGVLPKDYTMFSDDLLGNSCGFSIIVRWMMWAAMSLGAFTSISSTNSPKTSPQTTACSLRRSRWSR